MNPGHSRSPLLDMLRKAFRIASVSEKQNIPEDELADMQFERAYKRRQFIADMAKAGVVIGAASLINACKKVTDVATPGEDNVDNLITQPKIVIVGAGMAGLNCAWQLKKAGYASDVYEASKRVGGRMFTKKDILAPGLTTELGGEFIDSTHKDMLSLCSEFNLPLLDTLGASEAGLYRDSYFFNGQFYSIRQVIRAFKPYAARIQADIDSLPDVITFTNYGNADKFDKLSISAYFDTIGMTGWIRTALETAYMTEYGRETDDQSAINFLYLFSANTSKGEFNVFGNSDERYKISGGNQMVIDALYNKLKNRVHNEHVLVRVKKANKANYELSFLNANGSVITVYADVVVMTIPFSVLRNIPMEVNMPEWKTNAIQNLGYGTNAKTMLGFNKRVWRDYNYNGYVFTDGVVQNGWDNSQLQDGSNGGYTAFLGGKAGLALADGTAKSRATTFVEQLETIWPGCKKAFNGNAERALWPLNPFSLGSYACYKPGQFTTIAGAEKRTIGNMYFAGEHCSLAFQGYMNGAAQTGRRAAQDILTNLKTGKTITPQLATTA